MPSRTKAAARAGGNVLIRPLEPGDKPLIVAGLQGMSEQSRYRRFLASKPNFTASELAYLTEIDHHDHEALIAIDPTSGEAAGVARYVRLVAEPEVAEPAVAVVDDWQHQGVGTALLNALIERAKEEGIDRFRATILTENQPALDLVQKSGLPGAGNARQDGFELAVEFELHRDRRWRQLLDALRAAARGELEFKLPGTHGRHGDPA